MSLLLLDSLQFIQPITAIFGLTFGTLSSFFPCSLAEQKGIINLLLQFAVLYEARANTGIDRAKIIDAVAKSVPSPHKVDLSHPDIHIVVQIVKVRHAHARLLVAFFWSWKCYCT